MNRVILGIGAFILTFGISTSIVGLFFGFPKLSPSYTVSANSSISRVLDRDIYYGEKRRNETFQLLFENKLKGIDKSETIMSPAFAEIISRYASESAAIDVSATPPDFAYAWNDHMAAWNAQARLLKSASSSEHGSKPLAESGDKITETWFQVLRIAKRYGVPMKRRYFR